MRGLCVYRPRASEWGADARGDEGGGFGGDEADEAERGEATGGRVRDGPRDGSTETMVTTVDLLPHQPRLRQSGGLLQQGGQRREDGVGMGACDHLARSIPWRWADGIPAASSRACATRRLGTSRWR